MSDQPFVPSGEQPFERIPKPVILAPALSLPTWYRPLVENLDKIGNNELAAFGVPPGQDSKPSAVLVLFGEDQSGNPDVLLTSRSTTMRSHAGQVSFPGGAADAEDDGPIATAFREAREETQLDPSQVEPVALLPELFIQPSGFAVTTVLGWWRNPGSFGVGSPDEVDSVARVQVDNLANPANRVWVTHPMGYMGPGFVVDGLFIWGFTAIVLDKLMVMGGWDTQWQDSARTLPFDYRVQTSH